MYIDWISPWGRHPPHRGLPRGRPDPARARRTRDQEAQGVPILSSMERAFSWRSEPSDEKASSSKKNRTSAPDPSTHCSCGVVPSVEKMDTVRGIEALHELARPRPQPVARRCREEIRHHEEAVPREGGPVEGAGAAPRRDPSSLAWAPVSRLTRGMPEPSSGSCTEASRSAGSRGDIVAGRDSRRRSPRTTTMGSVSSRPRGRRRAEGPHVLAAALREGGPRRNRPFRQATPPLPAWRGCFTSTVNLVSPFSAACTVTVPCAAGVAGEGIIGTGASPAGLTGAAPPRGEAAPRAIEKTDVSLKPPERARRRAPGPSRVVCLPSSLPGASQNRRRIPTKGARRRTTTTRRRPFRMPDTTAAA